MLAIIESLDGQSRRAVALVGLMIKMHGGKDGEGAFQGVGRYGVLATTIRLCAEQSQSVQGFWDRMARRMRWTIGPQRYDDAALALIAPEADDADTLRALAERTQSIVMIARSLARRERVATQPHAIIDPEPLSDPLDVFFMEDVAPPPSEEPAAPASKLDDLFGE